MGSYRGLLPKFARAISRLHLFTGHPSNCNAHGRFRRNAWIPLRMRPHFTIGPRPPGFSRILASPAAAPAL